MTSSSLEAALSAWGQQLAPRKESQHISNTDHNTSMNNSNATNHSSTSTKHQLASRSEADSSSLSNIAQTNSSINDTSQHQRQPSHQTTLGAGAVSSASFSDANSNASRLTAHSSGGGHLPQAAYSPAGLRPSWATHTQRSTGSDMMDANNTQRLGSTRHAHQQHTNSNGGRKIAVAEVVKSSGGVVSHFSGSTGAAVRSLSSHNKYACNFSYDRRDSLTTSPLGSGRQRSMTPINNPNIRFTSILNNNRSSSSGYTGMNRTPPRGNILMSHQYTNTASNFRLSAASPPLHRNPSASTSSFSALAVGNAHNNSNGYVANVPYNSNSHNVYNSNKENHQPQESTPSSSSRSPGNQQVTMKPGAFGVTVAALPFSVPDNDAPVVPRDLLVKTYQNEGQERQFDWSLHPAHGIVRQLLTKRGILPGEHYELVEYHMAKPFLDCLSENLTVGAYFIRYSVKGSPPKDRFFCLKMIPDEHGRPWPYLCMYVHGDARQIIDRAKLEDLVGITADASSPAFQRWKDNKNPGMLKGSFIGGQRATLSTEGCFSLWFYDRKKKETRSLDLLTTNMNTYRVWVKTVHGILAVNSTTTRVQEAGMMNQDFERAQKRVMDLFGEQNVTDEDDDKDDEDF